MTTRFSSPYQGYDVLSKWRSPSWNEQTRAVVSARLNCVPERRFFDPSEWALLEAIAARLVPQPDRAPPVPVVPFIDEKLAGNRGEGYRYADMPAMREAWRRGLAAIAAESEALHGKAFASLAARDQDRLLKAVQLGRVSAAEWKDLPPKRFFKALLKEVVSHYYGHPSAWSEIGFGGPASPRGYVRMGFNERDPWEAAEAE